MNQITDPPNEYTFGHDFNYDVWTPDTEVTLANVPWSNDYRDVLGRGAAAANEFIDALAESKTLEYGSMSYILPNTPVRIPVSANVANKFNYVRVRNPKMPVVNDVQQDYFYFILDVIQKAGESTQLIVQLDAWTTYRDRLTFNRAFVERGHIGIANKDNYVARGRRWLTAPEGFDTGTDYEIVKSSNAWHTNLMNGYVLITSVTDLIGDPGSVDDPNLNTATGGFVQMVPTPTKTFALKWSDISGYFNAMKSYPWVTQGIIKVVVVPDLTDVGYTVEAVPRTNNYPPGPSGSGSSYLLEMRAYTLADFVPFNIKTIVDETLPLIPERYRGLKKFVTSPYMFVEVSNANGSSASFRPEVFSSDYGGANAYMSLVPGGERIEFVVNEYNGSNIGGGNGEAFDNAVVTGNLPNLPVVNDMAIGALASTTHGRSAARAAADWSQQIALDSNANAYDGAALSASTSLGNDAIMRNLGGALQTMEHDAQRRNQLFDAAGSVAMGAGGGGAVGGAAGAGIGALGGVATAAMSAAKMMRMQELDRNKLGAVNTASGNVSASNYNTATTINESNKGLADRAARGNYEQAIGAMNARVQDTMLTQPGLSGGFGGEFLRAMANGFVFIQRVRMIDRASMERIGEHWLRYGYAMRVFMKLPDSLQVMTKFTYWKMSEVYASTAEIPELYKRAMMGILEKGVTVWNDPNDIGAIDIATNNPLPNITIER